MTRFHKSITFQEQSCIPNAFDNRFNFEIDKMIFKQWGKLNPNFVTPNFIQLLELHLFYWCVCI